MYTNHLTSSRIVIPDSAFQSVDQVSALHTLDSPLFWKILLKTLNKIVLKNDTKFHNTYSTLMNGALRYDQIYQIQ